jgi:hypothetical protein
MDNHPHWVPDEYGAAVLRHGRKSDGPPPPPLDYNASYRVPDTTKPPIAFIECYHVRQICWKNLYCAYRH